MCKYKDDEGIFVVQSPMFERVIGVSDTQAEAWQLFEEVLDETYIAYLEGTLVGFQSS